MKRYLVFSTREYDAHGDMNDFRTSVDNLSEIEDSEWFKEDFLDNLPSSDIIHIFDTTKNLYYELNLYEIDSNNKKLKELYEFIFNITYGNPGEVESNLESNFALKKVIF